MMPDWNNTSQLHIVGKPAPRRSAVPKVTGQARYTTDFRVPGMLHCVVVRSKIARGRVVSIDESAAEHIPGVRLILTPWNFPPMPQELSPEGNRIHRRPPIAAEVRFVGDEVAAVVAESEPAAEEAASLLKIRYESYPSVIEPADALQPGAPQITAEVGNLLGGKPEVYQRGDLKKGESDADFVMECVYSTEVQHHNPLEPHCCVAFWQNDELTLWDSNQGPHAVKDHLMARLGLPGNKVRIINEYVGGGFGSKNRSKPFHYIAALASRLTGRPVRLSHNRRDEFIASRHRAKTSHVLRGGVNREGRITFLYHKNVGQDGADPLLAGVSASNDFTGRLYRCDNVRSEVYCVYTNTQSPVSFRGPAAAEELFCLEAFVDELADRAQIDPLEFRIRSYAPIDQVNGLPYSSKGLAECYELGAKRFGWKWTPPGQRGEGPVKRGIGMSSLIFHGLNEEQSQAFVRLNSDGTAEVVVGVSEFGNGIETILAQIAAEELGLRLEEVDVRLGDSIHTPYSIDSSYGSRTTSLVGPAVRAAAAQAKTQLLLLASAQWKLQVDDLRIENSVIRSATGPAVRIPVKEAAAGMGRERILGIGNRHGPMPGVIVQTFGAHFVEVEVDTDTGQVRVLRAVCAHDAGRWINPLLTESQIQGGFIQGMGMALFEERVMDRRNGMMLNDNMLSYFVPGSLDAPPEVIALEVPVLDPSNTIQAKGIGEPPLVAAGAAICNAVFNAIGVRIRSYPITPDKVLAALRSGRN